MILPTHTPCLANFAGGVLPANAEEMAAIVHFCLSAKQAGALAWLVFHLQGEMSPGQRLILRLNGPGRALTAAHLKFLDQWLMTWAGCLPPLAVDLSGQALAERNTALLARIVARPDCQIEELRLRGCSIPSTGLGKLLHAARHAPHLKVLDLSRNAIGLRSVKKLAELVGENKVLEELHISDMTIRSAARSRVADVLSSLKHNTSLRVLGCARMPITRAGLEGLQACTSLRSVDLRRAELVDLPGSAIFDALEKLPHLQEVALDGAQHEDYLGTSFLNVLKKPSLVSLHLMNVGLSPFAKAEMIERLATASIQSVDLSGMDLSLIDMEAFDHLVAKNSSMKTLRVDRCSLDMRALTGLQLRANSTLETFSAADNRGIDTLNDQIDPWLEGNREINERRHALSMSQAWASTQPGATLPIDVVRMVLAMSNGSDSYSKQMLRHGISKHPRDHVPLDRAGLTLRHPVSD